MLHCADCNLACQSGPLQVEQGLALEGNAVVLAHPSKAPNEAPEEGAGLMAAATRRALGTEPPMSRVSLSPPSPGDAAMAFPAPIQLQ